MSSCRSRAILARSDSWASMRRPVHAGQRFFRLLALGDVLNRAVQPRDVAGGLTVRVSARPHPSMGAVGADHLQKELVRVRPLKARLDGGTQAVPALAGYRAGSVLVYSRPASSDRGQQGERAPPTTTTFPVAAIPMPAADSREALGLLELHLLAPQQLFGVLAFRDIPVDAKHPLRRRRRRSSGTGLWRRPTARCRRSAKRGIPPHTVRGSRVRRRWPARTAIRSSGCK